MRRGLAAAAASATVALALSPLFAAPAHGQSSVTVTASSFAMSPAASPAMTTSAVSVSGHFHASGGFQPTFDWVSVNVVWDKGGPGPSQAYAYCGAPPNTQPNPKPCPPATQNTVDFDFKQDFNPPLAFNGPYKVTATGTAHDQSFLGNNTPVSATTSPISFGMAVPAPKVVVDPVKSATVNKDRSVTVVFNRDASTPDVQSYWIYRKGPGENTFHARAQTKQQTTGTSISVIDTGTEAAGGDYVYQIEEHRNGQTGDASSYTVSDRTQSQTNKVTVPNPPPGQTVPPPPTAPPSSGDSPPPVVKGTPSGVSRSSGFAGSSGSSAATTPTSEAVTPDPGFARGLPYAAGQTPNDQNSEGDNSAVAVTPGRHRSTNKGILIPVAGAAVLVLGALHLRYFKKRLDEPPTSLTPIA